MAVCDAVVYAAAVAVALGDRARAERYRAALTPFAGQLHDRLVDRALGELALCLGDLSAAGAHLAAAEAAARREELACELPRVLAAQAELELARGGRDAQHRGRARLVDAVALFDRVGMQGEAAQARARLDELTRRGGRRPRMPAGLSEREVEVLRLVAAGLSNRQIAERLVLSEKTVANHLAHIFDKVGCDNRAAATAFAVRNGLV